MLVAHSLVYTDGHSWRQLSEHNRRTHRCLPHCSDSLITTPGRGHPQWDIPCSWDLPLLLLWGLRHCTVRGLFVPGVPGREAQGVGGCPCSVSLGMVPGLVDGGAFQGRSMGAGCSAAQASSWRVLNPWESPAGSNKHKQPQKPELSRTCTTA